jgi:hypothetical protein
MGFRRFSFACRLLASRGREYLEFDSGVFKTGVGLIGTAAGLSCYHLGLRRKGLAILTKVHRSAALPWASRVVEKLLKAPLGAGGAAPKPRLVEAYEQYVADTPRTPASAKFFEDPRKLLGSRVLVLKSPRENEKGVVLIDYSYIFPLFERLFDIEKIAGRYHLVLEPTWSGYCAPDILNYSRFPFPVFVQSIEPRDTEFLKKIASNLIPVPVAGNWWVDHRVMRPIPGMSKDCDLIMLSGWGRFKRHARVFSALSRLRARGTRLKTILVGYPMDRTKDDIVRQAKHFGVLDLLEIYEWINPQEVNHHLNRARVQVVWSRREGFNRATIEGMFSGVPCILREGHNYGYNYPYINDQTGCFSSERDLPGKLLSMVESHERFWPRDWVMEHMSCQKATADLNDSIRRTALGLGERWTSDLVVKTVGLHTMNYWEPSDRQRFLEDYRFLEGAARNQPLA